MTRAEFIADRGQIAIDFDLSDELVTQYRHAYLAQRQATKLRGCDKLGHKIEFKLTFREWLTIWLGSGKMQQRGKYRGDYCMARHNDLGDYEVGNVSIVLQHVNNSKAHQGQKHTEAEKKRRSAANMGAANPKARKVLLNGVEYSTLNEAMEKTGLTNYMIRKLQQ